MESLQVPELSIQPSISTPLRKASPSNFPTPSQSSLPSSRSLNNSSISVYAAAALDANLRRQRSDSFVQQQPKSHRKGHRTQRETVRAPSQICLSRHQHVQSSALKRSTSHPPAVNADNTEIYYEEDDDDNQSTSSTASSSSSSGGSAEPANNHAPASSDTGAIIEGVLIRRAVRPYTVHIPDNDDNKETEKPTAKNKKKSKNQATINTSTTDLSANNAEREYWTPPPMMPASPESLHLPYTTFPAAIETSTSTALPSFSSGKKSTFPVTVKGKLNLKKSNSQSHSHRTHNTDRQPSKSHTLFHFGKRFQRQHDPSPDNNQFVHPPPPVPFEDQPETDRYGFRKASQWLTVEDHREHELAYQPTLERRLNKWERLLEEHDCKLPPRSKKVERYIRKGVPAHIRGRVWLHYSGAEAKMDANPGVYDKFLSKAEEMGDENEFADIIARDLHRTFPDNIQFRTNKNSDDTTTAKNKTDGARPMPAIIAALKRVLSAFSVYSPSIGYCQSLNFIVGMLLLFMKEEEAFWTLVTIVQNILPAGVYDVTMEGSNIDQTVLMMLLWERMPHLWNKVSERPFWDSISDGASMPTITLVTNHWFLTLFINILPIESVLRVWDCFFYEGASVLFRVALTLFKMNEQTVMSLNDSLEIFQVIQNMPKKQIDCQQLMENAYERFGSLTKVTNEDLERRREICRDRRRSGKNGGTNPSRAMPRHAFTRSSWKIKGHGNKTAARVGKA